MNTNKIDGGGGGSGKPLLDTGVVTTTFLFQP